MTEFVHHDRRSFLKSMGLAVGAAGAAGAAGAPALLSAAPAAAAARDPGGDVTGWGLELGDGFTPSGVMSSAMGGWPYYEVVEFESGDEKFTDKQRGALKYEDITVQFGTEMSADFYTMISDVLEGDQHAVDGAIVASSTNLMTHSRLVFHTALITEVSFPALDAGAKDAAKMTIKFMPEWTAFRHVAEKWNPQLAAKQKKWLVSNFKLEIAGLDCSRVNKIDAITVKQKVIEFDEGGERLPVRIPGKIEFPNIVITMADSTSEEFFKWWTGELSGDENPERDGKITWLSPDLKSSLGSLTLTNLGPLRVAHAAGPQGETIRNATVEMYCEQMSLQFDGSS